MSEVREPVDRELEIQDENMYACLCTFVPVKHTQSGERNLDVRGAEAVDRELEIHDKNEEHRKDKDVETHSQIEH